MFLLNFDIAIIYSHLKANIMIKRMLNKYCLVFLIITLSLLLGSSLVAASDDVDDTQVLDDSNMINYDNGDNIVQYDDNNQNNNNEVMTTNDDTQESTSSKEYVKKEKNIKGVDIASTLTMNASSGYPGDVIELTLVHPAQINPSYEYTYKVSLNDVVYDSGMMRPEINRYAVHNFTIPNVPEGEYTLKYSVNRTKAMIIVGTDTFTVLSSGPKLQIENDTQITGVYDNFILPVNIRDGENNPVNVETTITISDGDDVLVENYPITTSDNNIPIPVKRTGEYSLTVDIDQSSDYAKSTCMIPVNVNPVDTILTVDDNDEEIYSIINVLSNTVITGTLTTVNGNPVKNAALKVVVDGNEYEVLTNEQGEYSYQYPVTQLQSDIPISIEFTGSEGYNPTEPMSGTFDIVSVELIVTFDEGIVSEVNETTHLTGSVTDTFGLPLDNEEFNLTITGVDEVITVTSTEGTFSYDYVFTQAGTNTITASRDLSSGLYEMDETTLELTTIVGPKRTVLTVDVGQGSGNAIDIKDIEAYALSTITTGQLVDIFGEAVENAQITVLIDDETLTTTTDSEGNFQVIYNATQGSKDYDITVRFDGNDEYKPADDVYTGTFTTNPIVVKITLNDDLNAEYLLEENVLISGQATLLGAPYANGEISFTINDVTYTAPTDENGQFTYTYTTDTLGEIIIKSTESSLTINVVKPEVSVQLDDIQDSMIFVPIDITGKLLINSNQSGVQNTVVLTVNDESFDVDTDADGKFTYTYTPNTLGVYNVDVSFESPQYTTTNTDSQTFNVEKLRTRLISDELPVAVKLSEAFTIRGKLVDVIDRPIENAQIRIIVDDEEYTTLTDSEGVYSYDYQTTRVSDNYLYEVRFSGDENYDLARNYVGSFFDVESIVAYITVEANNSSVNMPTTITGRVSTSNGSPLANVGVKVEINNQESETTTNADGVYEVEYTPTKAGKFDVISSVDDDNYPIQTATTTFNVEKAATVTTVNPIVITSSYTVDLTAKVTDLNNNLVDGGKVVFKVNGKTLKDENAKVIYIKVDNGQAILSHTFTSDDIDRNTTVSASYSGSTSFASSSSQKVNLTLSDEHNILITLDDVNASAGQSVTLTANIKDNNENINGGKVIFKVNGKTIKDDQAKVIYADVTDGTASITYNIPTTMKAKNYTLTAVFINSLYNRTDATATLTIIKAEENNSLNSNKDNLLGDAEPKTIIINNDTIATYITNTGFTDQVNEADTLDFQGTISQVTGLTTIIIDKPVNIITSTNDGRIELFNNITFTRESSGSNVTGLFTFNTQFYVVNADNIVFDNISNVVDNKPIGSQVGQTSIRLGCKNITIKNSLIKTINNGGFSSLVFTGVQYSNVINNTIIGEGRVGNLFYFNAFNAGNLNESANAYNLIANNTIIGPSAEDSICYAVQMLLAKANIIENNTITYPGLVLSGGSADTIIRNNIVYQGRSTASGIYTNNTFNDNASLSVNKNSVAENNTIHGTLTAAKNSVVGSNVADNLVIGNNATVANVTINGNVSYTGDSVVSDSLLENSTIGGNIVLSASTSNGNDVANVIQNNNITGNITLSKCTGTIIANNNINGTINVSSTNAGNTTIAENNITTSNEYTVINYNKTTTIRNNQLITPTNSGTPTINDISGSATIFMNGPAYKLNITMETYPDFFDENGLFTRAITEEIIVTLHGPFNNVIMKFDVGEFKLVGYDENTILNDCIIIITDQAHIQVENITFMLTDANEYDNTAIKVQSDDNNITNNTITVSSASGEAAILVENAENTVITDNSITVAGGYAVQVINSPNTRITDNYLNTTMGKNNYAVLVDENSQNVLIENNTPSKNEVEIALDTIDGIVLEDIDATINLIDTTDSSIINDGTARIMINGESLTDENGDEIIFNVEDGKIRLTGYEIPTGWLRSDALMTIIYSGSTVYENTSIDLPLCISKRDATVEILSTGISAKAGDTITLQARITDGDQLVTNGKVAFKLNGNSLEDENGKLIYVNVVDGIATLEYTVTSGYSSAVYELTAVFENMIYDRAASSTDLVIYG